MQPQRDHNLFHREVTFLCGCANKAPEPSAVIDWRVFVWKCWHTSKLHVNDMPPLSSRPQSRETAWTFYNIDGSVSNEPHLLLNGGSNLIPVASLPLTLHIVFLSDMCDAGGGIL